MITNVMNLLIMDDIWCCHGACDNLLSYTMEWIGSMPDKQPLTAEKKILQKGVFVKIRKG